MKTTENKNARSSTELSEPERKEIREKVSNLIQELLLKQDKTSIIQIVDEFRGIINRFYNIKLSSAEEVEQLAKDRLKQVIINTKTRREQKEEEAKNLPQLPEKYIQDVDTTTDTWRSIATEVFITKIKKFEKKTLANVSNIDPKTIGNVLNGQRVKIVTLKRIYNGILKLEKQD